MKHQFSISAIVPIKAHSERIPKKNFRNFDTQPLHTYVIKSLQEAKSISRIYINTDSPEIVQLYREKEKVFVIDRPAKLCGDSVSMNKIIEHTLSIVKDEHVLQTHVTNPLIKPTTVELAVAQYRAALKQGYDTLFSVTKQQKRFFDKDGKPINHDPNKLINTQDLDPLFEENSNIYIFSKSSFAKKNNRLGLKPKMFEMEPLEAIDIDVLDDFVLAELIYKSNLTND